MKKILCMLLYLFFMIGVIAGCGETDDTPSGTSSSKPTPEPFVQVGTQIDGGEYHGLNWVYTDAHELIITGNLENGYPEIKYPKFYFSANDHDMGRLLLFEPLLFEYGWGNSDSIPWLTYRGEVETACLSFSGAESLLGFFGKYEKLTRVDLSGLDTGNVTSMGAMFWKCSSLTSLDLSGLDTGNVTDMTWMLYGCSGLTSLDLNNLDTGNVTDMTGMFWGCSGLTGLDLSALDTRNVTDMDGMFWGCSSLTNLDLSSFDTCNVTNMEDMFLGCDNLQETLVGSGWILKPYEPEPLKQLDPVQVGVPAYE